MEIDNVGMSFHRSVRVSTVFCPRYIQGCYRFKSIAIFDIDNGRSIVDTEPKKSIGVDIDSFISDTGREMEPRGRKIV